MSHRGTVTGVAGGAGNRLHHLSAMHESITRFADQSLSTFRIERALSTRAWRHSVTATVTEFVSYSAG